MTSYLSIFAIISTVLSTTFSNHNDLSSDDAAYDQEIEMMKKIEIANMKLKFLKQLGKEKAPTFMKSVVRLSKSVILQMVGSREKKPSEKKQKDSVEMFFVPVNSDFECEKFDISFCQRFEFRISSDAEPSSAEFWVYKLKSWPFKNVTTTVLCSHSGQDILKQEDFPNENITEEWIFFHLSAFNDIKFGEENFTCQIEIKGITMDLNNLPYLKMVEHKEVRVRREIPNDMTLDTDCKIVSFNVSFEEYGGWVVHPPVYQANICAGNCSHVRNQHENHVRKHFENRGNETKCYPCWFTCCKPVEYKDLQLAYWKNENTTETRTFKDMIVSSCSCS